MILTALAVMYINTDQTRAAGEAALARTYQVFTISDDQSAAKKASLGLVNSFVFVCGVAGFTFVIVLLYKYKCMKVLIGYMVLASILLLGFLGGQLFYVAISKYQLAIDQISFYVTLYNFAIVGVIAVFYQKGMPMYINQAYLVATSVIVAWQLSYFNDWMAWALLIMLALYDLCAVLTPCGPLKALVNLMSKDDAPSMPGLLYEAQLPANATRPGRGPQRGSASGPEEGRTETQQNADGTSTTSINADGDASGGGGASRDRAAGAHAARDASVLETTQGAKKAPSRNRRRKCTAGGNARSDEAASSEGGLASAPSPLHEPAPPPAPTPLREVPIDSPVATVPLAIAKIYKLPIVSPGALEGRVAFDASSPTAYLQEQFSAAELRTNVEAKLPRNGGRIETTRNKKGKPQYVVYNKDEVKRTLTVDERGTVLEIVRNEDYGKPDPSDNTIKLGLGDFIFYSVLVSKAAENGGFAPFVACFLSVLTGLGGTLVLLAVYHHALPALPISIFLAVIMFVLTLYCMEPWIEDMWRAGPFYI